MTAARIILAQLRTNSRVRPAPHPQGPPICQGQDSNLTPRTYAIDSLHILTTNRGAHSYRTGYPAEVALVGFAVGTTYPAN